MFIFWDCTNGSDSNIAQLFSVTFLIVKHKSCFWLTKINTFLSLIQCLVYLQLKFPFKVQSQRESPLFWSLSQLSGQGRANIYTDNHPHSYSLKPFYSINIIVLIYSFLWLYLLKFSYKSINIYKKDVAVTTMSYTLSVDISCDILLMFSSLTTVIYLLENKVNYDK